MSKENLTRILDNISDLPTLPTVYMRINRLLQSPDSNVSEIARIIESDQAISSKVLRLVNSSFFGFSRKVTQINHAVVLLGFNAVRNTVLSISVFESFKSSNSGIFDRREFWKHSIATGIIARLLAKELKLGQEEEAFSGGILHDLGKLVLDQHLPKRFARILD
ncbi:MAG: HDOD domain-containing protein, partial [Calditrichaeota bacterium]